MSHLMPSSPPRPLRLPLLLAVPLLLALAGVAVAEERDDAEDTLPTPFSAAEIRAGWPEGFWLDTRATSPAGERLARTVVTGWAEDEVTLVEVVLEDGRAPTGAEIDAAQAATLPWEELEGHARFAAANTTRERVRRSTALGDDLEGWLYRVRGADGSVSEFFFADGYPGPPVLYSQSKDGEQQFVAEQVARRPPS